MLSFYYYHQISGRQEYTYLVGKVLEFKFHQPICIEHACTIVSTQYIPTIYTHAMPNGYLPPATRHWNEYDRQATLPIYAYQSWVEPTQFLCSQFSVFLMGLLLILNLGLGGVFLQIFCQVQWLLGDGFEWQWVCNLVLSSKFVIFAFVWSNTK